MRWFLVLSIALVAAFNLHAQQTGDSQDSADLSAAEAAIQQVQQAAEKLKSATPDAATIREAQYQQHMHEHDAESKTDLEIAKEKIPDVSKDAVDKMKDHIADKLGGEILDNGTDLSWFSSLEDVLDTGKAFLEASTPSFTAGPSRDQVPSLRLEQQQNLDNRLNQWSAAQDQYIRAMQNLADVAGKHAATHPIPQPKPSGPTIGPAPKACPSGSVCTTH